MMDLEGVLVKTQPKCAAALALLSLLGTLSACTPEPDAVDQGSAKESAEISVGKQTIGSFELQAHARVESDEAWRSTTLTLNFVKLDNSLGNQLALVVKFGEGVTCATHRRFDVYASHGRGGNVYMGELGHQELRCEPYTPASAFAELGAPTVAERNW
jgi:hypothetical protein